MKAKFYQILSSVLARFIPIRSELADRAQNPVAIVWDEESEVGGQKGDDFGLRISDWGRRSNNKLPLLFEEKLTGRLYLAGGLFYFLGFFDSGDIFHLLLNKVLFVLTAV
jgi:hypothetical protein